MSIKDAVINITTGVSLYNKVLERTYASQAIPKDIALIIREVI